MGFRVGAITFIIDSLKLSEFSSGKYDFISRSSPISRVSGNSEVDFSSQKGGRYTCISNFREAKGDLVTIVFKGCRD